MRMPHLRPLSGERRAVRPFRGLSALAPAGGYLLAPPGRGFVYARSKRRFAPDKKARSSQSAVSLVTTGFPSASSSGVNPPAYPLTIKR